MQLEERFRRLVFAQVLLGVVAFCMAEPNPGLLLMAGALTAMSWYVTEGPTGRPLPRWAITLAALAAVAWLGIDLVRQQGDLLVVMGHFVMWLQVVVLYGEKRNSEFAQLLVLSVLLMIAASALPGGVTMIFGLLLGAYCVMSLFTVLLFQLKLAADVVHDANRAAAPAGAVVSRPKPVFGRGVRWHLRGAAGLVGLGCGGVAVVIFIVTPRSGAGPSNVDDAPLALAQTGFSNQVKLTGAAPASGRREPVLNLTVKLQGQNVGNDLHAWLLRGAALDQYDHRSHTWTRSATADATDLTLDLPAPPGRATLVPHAAPDGVAMLEAEVILRGFGARTLFSIFPPAAVASPSLGQVSFSPLDHQLEMPSAQGAVLYQVFSPMAPAAGDTQPASRAAHGVLDTSRYAADWDGPSKSRLRRLALSILRQANVITDEKNTGPIDPHAAQNALVGFFREQFRYSVTNPATRSGADPLIEFLFNHRSGHCELFASGLAALLRSVDIPARVITGFRAAEFNQVGGYYVVRPTHAHAWVESRDQDGAWRTLDPTPPAAIDALQRPERSLFTSIRELYEYLEFQWLRTVVAYDRQTRQKLLSDVQLSFSVAAASDDTWLGRTVAFFRSLPERWQFDRLANSLIIVISFFIVVGCLSLIRMLVLHRRRLAALQLTALPRRQRRTLARRLHFYLRMLDLLERHGYVRPSWQSPFSFAQELAAANPLRFDPVLALTELFYEVRFGHRRVDNDRRHRIKAHLRQLESGLAARVA